MKTKTNVKSGNFNSNNLVKNTIKLNRDYNFSRKVETLVKIDLKDFFNLVYKYNG